MHHVRWHFGDWRKAVRGCSLLERGAYAALLEELYVDEEPLPADDEELLSLIGARGTTEERAVMKMRDRFFTKNEKGYVQKRALAEINAFKEIGEKRAAAGLLGAVARHKRLLEQKPTTCPANAVALDTANAKQMPRQTAGNAGNHQPVTNNQEPVTINQQPGELPSGGPPAVEFPPGFPDTERKAIDWARGGAVIINRPDAWILEVWQQTIGRGFRDGADVLITSWVHYLASRQNKRNDSLRDSAGFGSQKKESAAKPPHPLDIEPEGEWRGVAQEIAMEEGWTVGDFTQTSWRAMPPNVRELITRRLAQKKGSGSL